MLKRFSRTLADTDLFFLTLMSRVADETIQKDFVPPKYNRYEKITLTQAAQEARS